MFLPSSSDVNMFSLQNMPSTATLFSMYTTLSALSMLIRSMVSEIRTIANQLIPRQLQEKIFSRLGSLFGSVSSTLTLVIDQSVDGYNPNQIYEASEIYLSTKITPSIGRLRVRKSLQEKNLSVTIEKGEVIIDFFQGIELKWRFICSSQTSGNGNEEQRSERRSFELSFHKKHKEIVLNSYLKQVVRNSKGIQEENKAVKLYSHGSFNGVCDRGGWSSINLDHPSTFDTLAMDAPLKKELMDDLDRFVKRREFYRRVGKAWKRGYLLYGPPGTGKSSLIAAIANYLNFSIYDLDLTNIWKNSDLRRLLVSTSNRSILVIEDIDCSVELPNRQSLKEPQISNKTEDRNMAGRKLTLSGLLNFIDGLWSCCGDERIIIFTTNHKERLDPALLRPGRMDMHIHMSYCTPSGFKQLASNYHGISNHGLFQEIEELIMEVDVTPAEVAEELMRSDDANIALQGLNKLLQRKKFERNEAIGGGEEVDGQGQDEEGEKKTRKIKKKKVGKNQLRKLKGRKGRNFEDDD
ncbi:hypothetical protein HHK36_010173 [Tetracentron sinense]|uniref:AAA+ ATPase domain-containing protein n=1 Tax=Tetracentron sinense TaxID=13715 RepID=A0A835DM51_TETSI|nr:hypothetical protein HHK36_010173 [Tetracentron sinense]